MIIVILLAVIVAPLIKFVTYILERVEKVPVIFHNLRGYDEHLVLKALQTSEHVTCIPNNKEKILLFSVGNLIFFFFFYCLTSSLDTLAQTLLTQGREEKVLKIVNNISKRIQNMFCEKMYFHMIN